MIIKNKQPLIVEIRDAKDMKQNYYYYEGALKIKFNILMKS